MYANLPINQQKFIKRFVIAIITVYVMATVLSAVLLRSKPPELASTPVAQIHSDAKTPETAPSASPTTEPIKIHTGIYLDEIENVSIKDSYWTTTFFVWFTWKGDKSLDPGKSFQLVSAQILKKEIQDSYTSPDGTNYQCYKIVAKMTKFFNTTYMPLDQHVLDIYIEDAALDDSKLVYVVDPASNINPAIELPGFKIEGFSQDSQPHLYPTTFGDPRLSNGDFSSYSQYDYAIQFKRAGLGFFFKLFIGMFAGVLLTLGSFFIRPADTGPRYGIPSAAYFGAVGNTYMVNSLLPPSGLYGLTDLVTGLGLLTITLCVGATLLSTYYYLRKDDKEFSKAIDSASWKAFGACYFIVNIALLMMVPR